jgi:pimeloyl-ACP methyl ester carboxylesterase
VGRRDQLERGHPGTRRCGVPSVRAAESASRTRVRRCVDRGIRESENVKALVFIDAFVPDEGESVTSLLSGGPPPPSDFLIAVPFGTHGDADMYLNPKYYGAVFASDIPAPAASLMAVTQRPLAASSFDEKTPAAVGWKTLPSWYVVGDADLVIPPPLQLMMAERAKSTITHVNGSHPSMIQHPEATVAAIVAATHGIEASADGL